MGTQLILPHRCTRYLALPLKLCGDLGQVLFHPFHLRDEESIIRSMKYSNVVINLVGRDYPTKNFSMSDVNVEGCRTLARLAKQCNVERFIHMSSLNVENPTPMILPGGSEVLKTKWQGECAVKEEFPEATIIRPSVVYGQEDHFMTYYLSAIRRTWRNIPLWKKGKETEKQPVHVSDVAAGIAAIATNPRTAGKTYQFVGPRRYTLETLIRWFYDIACHGYEDVGYDVSELKTNLLFRLQVAANGAVHHVFPLSRLTWDILERDHTSDKVIPSLPTLEDLGIVPINMESQIPWEVRPYKFYDFYTEELGEIIQPKPPQTVPLR
ncbi:NADH dehydrogenase [ubiquinone] 1 alpha subcomplex subunit 9, mitochondrial isoform X2 [Colletes gigas]|nr:NADH dehydrogenase [ubiquinone] 1 alpha subcomplex subunit 9, mitochondrial isoform X2 [Colletes gigas]